MSGNVRPKRDWRSLRLFKRFQKSEHSGTPNSQLGQGVFFQALVHCLLIFGGLAPALAETSRQTGPGIPKIDFGSNQVGQILSQNTTNKAISGALMHDGYLFIPMGRDGGGNGAGAFAFYDITDPQRPRSVFDSRSNTARYHTPGTLNYVGHWGEAHSIPMTDNKMIIAEHNGEAAWISIFDVTGFPAEQPKTLGRVQFPDVTRADGYSGNSFSPALLGDRYVYAPAGSAGLFIVDIGDPTNPRIVRRMLPNELGSQVKMTAVVIGHWLILSPSFVGARGDVIIFDISNPIDPLIIGSFDVALGYQGWICGSEFFTGADGPIVSYNFADPSAIVRRQYNDIAQDTLFNPEYGFCKDRNVFIGHYPGMTKWDLKVPSAPLVATANPTNPAADDYAFLTPIGNMIVVASDHNHPNNWNIAVHESAFDRRAPEVEFVLPADRSTNNSVRSKIGISLSDFPDGLSVNAATIDIRPVANNGDLGDKVAGSFSQMFGVVNFLPRQNFLADTTYRVVLKAGGLRDWAGNAVVEDKIISTFSTGSVIRDPVVPKLIPPGNRVVGDIARLSVNDNGQNASYAWNFGDGTPTTEFTSATTIDHRYREPGNYKVTLFIKIGSEVTRQIGEIVISNPLADVAPVQSSTIVFDAAGNRVLNVNPDNNTVSAVDGANHRKLFEVGVGASPQSVAVVDTNRAWVVNKDDATITVVNTGSGAVVKTISLKPGSAPHAVVVDRTARTAYVSQEGTSSIVKLALPTGQLLAELPVTAWPRNLGFDGKNRRLFVGHFISADSEAKVSVIDTTSFALDRIIALGLSREADSPNGGRGLPNYLGALALSPDLTQALVPAKKDNIQRGLIRDGQDLNFEHTVRGMAAQLSLPTQSERIGQRIDFDNNDFATAAAYSPLGNRVFVTTSGSSAVWIVDAYDTAKKVAVPSGGDAPRGVVTSADGGFVYLHNFMSRSVSVFAADGASLIPVAEVDVVAQEQLPDNVLAGKRVFYNSVDTRITQENYMSCSSCHLDGGHDGRTWDFSGLGEGFRNTIDLRGKAGSGHGLLHWTANFDEVHDFEGQMRTLNKGRGFLSATQFLDTQATLGMSKANLSPSLDALSDYLESLSTVGLSPFRNSNGSLTPAAIRGKRVFGEKGCNSCHDGDVFTDSPAGRLHNVGTKKATSGQRLGSGFQGFDTPTLKGLWASAPYLHDGSAQSLGAAVRAHRNISMSAAELQDVVEYIGQIDDNETQACSTTGRSCNDHKNETINDVIGADCRCEGTFDPNRGADFPTGHFILRVKHSGLSLSPSGNSSQPGASIRQVRVNPDRFRFELVGTSHYRIVNVRNGLVMDVQGSSNDSGADVIQATRGSSDSQLFEITNRIGKEYEIKNLNSGYCLDLFNGNRDDGGNVIQWFCTGNSNQTFVMEASSVDPSDRDGDGTQNSADRFADDSSETRDSDQDGAGDNRDAFPNDPTETMDSDIDGVGDNEDAFPFDPSNGTDPVEISVADSRVVEDARSVNVVVKLSRASTNTVSVKIHSRQGTATGGSDYVGFTRTVRFAAGVIEQRVPIVILDDGIAEPAETFSVRLFDSVNGVIASDSARVTIVDNDSSPVISVTGASVSESATVANATVRLARPSEQRVSVRIHTRAGTATGGNDYYGFTKELIFAPGATSQTVGIQILDDDVSEPTERFRLRLFAPTNATIENPFASVVINDDDGQLPRISIANTVVDESTGTARIAVVLSRSASTPISVKVFTRAGSARGGSDYYGITETIDFAPGSTRTFVDLTILDDSVIEPTETLTLHLFEPVNSEIATPSAEIRITDND